MSQQASAPPSASQQGSEEIVSLQFSLDAPLDNDLNVSSSTTALGTLRKEDASSRAEFRCHWCFQAQL
jgi:hypothetical protein